MADEIDFRNMLPDQLRSFVGCFVEIDLCEGGKLQGWVYTIDPVSYAVVIAKESEEDEGDSDSKDTKPIVIVMAKAIKQFRILETEKSRPEWLNDFACEKTQDFTSEELQKRKDFLVDWLKKNRVPLLDKGEEGDRIMLLGGLEIEPPYDAHSCQGTNEIVLERIRKLINAMPKK